MARVEVTVSLDLDIPEQRAVYDYLDRIKTRGRYSPRRDAGGFLLTLGYNLFSGKIPVVQGRLPMVDDEDEGGSMAGWGSPAPLPKPQDLRQIEEEIGDAVEGFGFTDM